MRVSRLAKIQDAIMTRTRILVVDDEPKIRTVLRKCLEAEGYRVTETNGATDTLEQVSKTQFDLITLDINLGRESGFDVARKIRQTSDTPIIMVTGKGDLIDRVVGLEIGADDYITKPFHLREVLARIHSVLRRTKKDAPSGQTDNNSGSKQHPDVKFDGMVAHLDRYELMDRQGVPCELTSGDFKLLGVFLNNPKRPLTRETLLDLTGGIEWTPLDRTIDNQVARLRKKIERDLSRATLIKTVRGIGYMFTADVEAV